METFRRLFFLCTYFTSLPLTTGWGLIPGIYLFRLAASLKTYFNEALVGWNNNLSWDVLIGFERSSQRLEWDHSKQTRCMFVCCLKVHDYPRRCSTAAHRDALRVGGFASVFPPEGLSAPLYMKKCSSARLTLYFKWLRDKLLPCFFHFKSSSC